MSDQPDTLGDVLAEVIAAEPGRLSDLGQGGGTREARAVRRAGWISPGEHAAAVRIAQADAWARCLESVTSGVQGAATAHREQGSRQAAAALGGLAAAIPLTGNPYTDGRPDPDVAAGARALREAADDIDNGNADHEALRLSGVGPASPLGWSDKSVLDAYDSGSVWRDWLRARADEVQR